MAAVTLAEEDVDALVAELKSLRAIVVNLQLRVADLERRPAGLQWQGVWDHTRAYRRDEAVTDRGSVWVAVDSSRGKKPGEHPQFWRLCVKRGADGKHGKSAP